MSKKPWVQTIRRETGLIEHICKHGVGHPAFGSADWMALTSDSSRDSWLVHGCDGCCHPAEWDNASLKESVSIANQMIVDHKDAINKLLEMTDSKINDLSRENENLRNLLGK